MKIAICGSLNFTHEIKKVADDLKDLGFDVIIPISSEKILKKEFSLEEIKKEKENGKFSERAIKFDSIRAYWKIIENSDAVLVVNIEKNNIKNYIGGNSFLEMGFAHVLNKKIFLFNDIPEMIYIDEIKAMQPVVLKGDLGKIDKIISKCKIKKKKYTLKDFEKIRLKGKDKNLSKNIDKILYG